MPLTPVTGGVSTGTISAERVKTLRMEKVFELEPYKTPMLKLLALAGFDSVGSYRWDWQEEVRAADACYLSADAQEWSNTGAVSTPTATIDVDHPNAALSGTEAFMVGDIVQNISSPTVGITGKGWLARVTAIPSATKLTVEAIGEWEYAGGDDVMSAVDAIGENNDEIRKVANAFSEGSSAPNPQHNQTDNVHNFIQPVRHTYETTKTLDGTDLYGMPEFQRRAARTMGIHKLALEYLAFFGRRSSSATSGAQPFRTTNGCLHAMSTNVLSATALADYTYHGGSAIAGVGAVGYDGWYSDSELLGLYGNGTKIGFCGPSVMTRFASPTFWTNSEGDNASATGGRFERDPMSDVLRMVVRTLETEHLTLRLVNHKEIFRSRTDFTANRAIARTMVVLDMAGDIGEPGFKGVYQKGLQTQVEENIQLPGDHVRRDGVFTYIGFQLINEAKHGVRYFS